VTGGLRGGRDDDELLGEQRRAGQADAGHGLRRRLGDQGDVDGAHGELLDEQAGAALGEMQLDPGVSCVEGAHRLRHEADEGGRCAEADAPSPQSRQLAHLLADRIRLRQHPLRAGEQGLARGGEGDVPAGPVEELRAELSLQRGDLPAQRGLGEVQALGRPREVPQPGHLDEAAELLQIHVRSLS